MKITVKDKNQQQIFADTMRRIKKAPNLLPPLKQQMDTFLNKLEPAILEGQEVSMELIKQITQETNQETKERSGTFNDINGLILALQVLEKGQKQKLLFQLLSEYDNNEALFIKTDLLIIVKSLMANEGLEDIVSIGETTGAIDPEEGNFIKEIFAHSRNDVPVLIVGETGTSKTYLARVIHQLSKRRNRVFSEVNCVGLPETLIESELFGHRKGSFTGAVIDKVGAFKKANMGTLFLDELGKIPKSSQAKLLKAIEEQKIHIIGMKELKPESINVRVIAAVQPEDLENIIPDLLHRLGYSYHILMPSLDERLLHRPEIIIRNSLRLALRKAGVPEITITSDAFNVLSRHKYKGNYRELENILYGAIIQARDINDRYEILPEDLMPYLNKVFGVKETQQPLDLIIGSHDFISRIKLKDIFDYADNLKKLLIEEKVRDILSSGGELKSVLLKEGLPEKRYQPFTKKIRNVLGISILDFKKTVQSFHH